MYLDQGQARQRLGMVRLKYTGGGGVFFFCSVLHYASGKG